MQAPLGTVLDVSMADMLVQAYPEMLSLDLRNNDISALNNLQPLGHLHELILDNNRLETLEGLHGLTALTRLSARSNMIVDLGESIGGLPNLQRLDVAHNNLSAGPWIHALGQLSQLTDLDVAGNPVCELPGSSLFIAAALPGLRRLNGVALGPPPVMASQPQHVQQYPSAHAPDSHDALVRDVGPVHDVDSARRRHEDVKAMPAPSSGNRGSGSLDAPAEPATQALQAQNSELQTQLLELSMESNRLQSENQALLESYRALEERVMPMQDALHEAESLNAQLQQQLRQQAAAASQLQASTCEQVTALATERDAAVRHAEALAAQLSQVRAAAEQAHLEERERQRQLEEMERANRQLAQELTATRELLLAEKAVPAAAPVLGPAKAVDGGAAAEALVETPGRGASVSVQQALEQRVAALQHVVRMQEQELMRLSDLEGAPRSDGITPWREQVQLLHEQLEKLSNEGAEQRTLWGLQLAEMREQFAQAMTLLEVLQQKSREQRAESAQLQARSADLASQLQREAQRAVHLQEQLAKRDAAEQTVRKQLVAFKTHIEQQAAALESRATDLTAHAARMGYACKRLGFVLRFAAAAWRGQHMKQHQQHVRISLSRTPIHSAWSGGSASGFAAAATAATLAAASTPLDAVSPGGGWPRAPARAIGSTAAAGVPEPVGAALQQELSKLTRDREVLLQQLLQVSSSAEERIRSAQAAAHELEARQRDALVSSRVQAAQQAAEAAAGRRVQAAEAALASQAAQVRQQVQEAVWAAEELCRRTEAAAGVRLSRALVRLQDVAQQVSKLRESQKRSQAAAKLQAAERQRLEEQLAAAQEAEAEAGQKLGGRDREERVRLAELRAAHEEALAAERRRASEAERLAARAAAECGALERQVARLREVRAQQEDARMRRLQSQLHEQEGQLRSLRRERSSLLAVLRQHGLDGGWSPGQQHNHKQHPASSDSDVEAAADSRAAPPGTAGSTELDVTRSGSPGARDVSLPLPPAREQGPGPTPKLGAPPQQAREGARDGAGRTAGGGGAGRTAGGGGASRRPSGLIASILRGGPPRAAPAPAVRDDTAAERDSGGLGATGGR